VGAFDLPESGGLDDQLHHACVQAVIGGPITLLKARPAADVEDTPVSKPKLPLFDQHFACLRPQKESSPKGGHCYPLDRQAQ
jgi:hypothetical protein